MFSELGLKWLQNGRIRHGQLYTDMVVTRKSFVSALKYCKRNKEKISDSVLAASFHGKRSNIFWKEVKKRRPANKLTATKIDGFKESKDIVNVFHDKFKAITGSLDGELPVRATFSPNLLFRSRFMAKHVMSALSQLKVGIGYDGIHSNHLKFTSPVIVHYIARFINTCFIHNHFPENMLSGVIRPVVKDKCGDIESSINYREVMISCNFFKLVEYLILPYIKKVSLNPYQFAYRNNSSTILANSILRETLKSNLDGDSCIYGCLLDLSKAFERVDHRKLLKVLEGRLPTFVVALIERILFCSKICVTYNECFSSSWNIVRGVRQGGVISAFLFNIYINDILECISQIDVGCKLGISRINVMAYADDMILLSPSVKSLQLLIDKMHELLDGHNLKINVGKTAVIIFGKNRALTSGNVSLFFNGTRLNVLNSVKYLGCVLTSDLNDSLDIDRCNVSFTRSFGFLFRKFNSVNVEVFYSLFESYCNSFYGAELWLDRKKCLKSFKQCGVSYHSALKKILGIPRFYSNHFTCDALNAFTFENFLNLKCLKFLLWLNKCNSECFYVHKYYFLNNSRYIYDFNKLWFDKYDVTDVLNNDFSALISRIRYVQNREESSMFFGV